MKPRSDSKEGPWLPSVITKKVSIQKMLSELDVFSCQIPFVTILAKDFL